MGVFHIVTVTEQKTLEELNK